MRSSDYKLCGCRHGHKLLSRNTMNRQPVTGGRQHRTPATLTTAFHEEPGRILFEVDKTCVDDFGTLPRFIVNLLENECFVCVATARMKTALGILLFQGTWHKLFHWSYVGNALVASAFPPVSPLVYGYDHHSLPNFWCPSITPVHLTHTS